MNFLHIFFVSNNTNNPLFITINISKHFYHLYLLNPLSLIPSIHFYRSTIPLAFYKYILLIPKNKYGFLISYQHLLQTTSLMRITNIQKRILLAASVSYNQVSGSNTRRIIGKKTAYENRKNTFDKIFTVCTPQQYAFDQPGTQVRSSMSRKYSLFQSSSRYSQYIASMAAPQLQIRHPSDLSFLPGTDS